MPRKRKAMLRLKVFVSSIMRKGVEDLSEERRAAKLVLDSMADLFEAWMFEDQPASGMPFPNQYLDAVAGCDIFALILGETLTPPVEEEFKIAMQTGRSIVTFRKQVENPSEAVNSLVTQLGRKYVKFSSVEEFSNEFRRALSGELLQRAQGGAPATPQSVQNAHHLRMLADSQREVEVTPIFPELELSHRKFTLERVGTTFIYITKTSSCHRVELPIQAIRSVHVAQGASQSRIVLDGRLQWSTFERSWKYFPDDAFKEKGMYGFGRPRSLTAEKSDEVIARLQALGLEMHWPRILQVSGYMGEGHQVLYDEDGYYWTLGQNICMVKPL